MRKKTGFTLVELLVVISIIALLLSMLMPALNRARGAAQQMVCASNLRSIHMGLVFYAESNDGYMSDYDNPQTFTWRGIEFGNETDPPNPWNWMWHLRLTNYLENPEVFECPSQSNWDDAFEFQARVGDSQIYRLSYTGSENVYGGNKQGGVMINQRTYTPEGRKRWKLWDLERLAARDHFHGILISDGFATRWPVNNFGRWFQRSEFRHGGSRSRLCPITNRPDRPWGRANFLVADGRIGALQADEMLDFDKHRRNLFGMTLRPSHLE